MAVSVLIASSFHKLTGGRGRVEVEGKDMAELIEALESRFPGMRASLLNERGQVFRHLNIYLNETDIEALDGLATSLRPGDQVALVPAIAGGS